MADGTERATVAAADRSGARPAIFLRGIRVPPEWLDLPGCLLPAVLVAETGRLPENLVEDGHALLGWRTCGGRQTPAADVRDIDAAVDAMCATLAQARRETLWLDEDELVFRLMVSFDEPEFIWDKRCGDENFSPRERAGSSWRS